MYKILLISIVLFLVLVNIIFRIAIIKRYKKLASKNIFIAPKLIFKKQELDSYIDENYPQYKTEIKEYMQLLNRMVKFTLAGFFMILLIFLYIKYGQ